ncbi:MAG: hypothetical protein HS101_08480 [Planctomycetia bacterium]|nr:hypothetical protein [Planctomycetia bacterium]MCC7316581.1 hypothetical protein [Planctomycetota bacterium]
MARIGRSMLRGGIVLGVLLSAGCTADLPAGLLNLFAGGVTIVVENATAYKATPRLSTSSATNLIEEITSGSDSVNGVGQDGVVAANQTESTTISCSDDIEVIIFEGASFESSGLPIGGVGNIRRLERDKDFSCGDTIRVRLTGGIFSFRAEVEVERALSFNPFAGGSTESESERDSDSIADALDRLFGNL